jgi:hypothetical protein
MFVQLENVSAPQEIVFAHEEMLKLFLGQGSKYIRNISPLGQA